MNELAIVDNDKYLALKSGARVLLEIEQELGEPLSPFTLKVQNPSGKDNKWRLPDGTSMDTITCVVLYTTLHNVRWIGQVGDGSLPVCKSADGYTGVGDPGGNCQICPHSRKGSHPKAKVDPMLRNKRGCDHRRLLVIMCEGEEVPYFISAPPASLAPLQEWMWKVRQHKPKLPYCHMLTKLKLMQKQKPTTHCVVTGEIVAPIMDKDFCKAIDAYAASFQPVIDAFLEQAGEILMDGTDS